MQNALTTFPIAFVLVAVLLSAPALAQDSCTLTVTTITDGGDGSLRQAVENANGAADEDVICFGLSGDGPHTIRLTSPLPAITQPVVLDGYTQDGASENSMEGGTNAVLMVELDGSEAGDDVSGLLITGDGSTVRGLVINRFDEDGITISSGRDNLIEGNFLGSDVLGTSPAPNDDDGLSFLDGASENEVRDNVLSGNIDDGLDMKDAGTSGNVIRDNLIGTTAAGTAALPNEDDGVDLDSGVSDNLFLDNVISSNGDNGVDLQDPGTTGNVFQRNMIGTDVTGGAPLGNLDEGVDIEADVRGNVFGGTEAGEGNVIAYNEGNGIEVEDSASGSIAIIGNAIYGNAELGIDLESDGPTPNDPGDDDVGPNSFQNFPEIRNLSIDDAGDLLVTYVVDSEPGNSAYPIRAEFFLADAGGQEGQVFLGFDEYAETDWDGCGSAPCTKTATLGPSADFGVEDGDLLLATATDAEDNTSEFSTTAYGVAIEGDEAIHQIDLALHSPYPNPTIGLATVGFDLAVAGPVRLAVYDVLGREVAVLVNEERPAGLHETVLDASAFSGGVYVVRLVAAGVTRTTHLTLVR